MKLAHLRSLAAALLLAALALAVPLATALADSGGGPFPK